MSPQPCVFLTTGFGAVTIGGVGAGFVIGAAAGWLSMIRTVSTGALRVVDSSTFSQPATSASVARSEAGSFIDQPIPQGPQTCAATFGFGLVTGFGLITSGVGGGAGFTIGAAPGGCAYGRSSMT